MAVAYRTKVISVSKQVLYDLCAHAGVLCLTVVHVVRNSAKETRAIRNNRLPHLAQTLQERVLRGSIEHTTQ